MTFKINNICSYTVIIIKVFIVYRYCVMVSSPSCKRTFLDV